MCLGSECFTCQGNSPILAFLPPRIFVSRALPGLELGTPQTEIIFVKSKDIQVESYRKSIHHKYYSFI